MAATAGRPEPGRAGRPAETDLPARRLAWSSEHAHMQADLARTVNLLDTIARVERDVARTLRATAGLTGGEAAQRRLKLAEQAVQGAHAAIERSEQLHQQAQRWQQHVELVRLQHALDRASGLLADLAYAEKDIAGILLEMAADDGSELAAQRRLLARQAQAAARRARDRARALRQLAANAAGAGGDSG